MYNGQHTCPPTAATTSLAWGEGWDGFCQEGSWASSPATADSDPLRRRSENDVWLVIVGYEIRILSVLTHSPKEPTLCKNKDSPMDGCALSRDDGKLGNVWVFVQLIFSPCWPMNQLNSNQNNA